MRPSWATAGAMYVASVRATRGLVEGLLPGAGTAQNGDEIAAVAESHPSARLPRNVSQVV